jgi:DNA-binding CsgD family transcriptional regulator
MLGTSTIAAISVRERRLPPRPRRLSLEVVDERLATFTWAVDDVPAEVPLTNAERDVLARIAAGASNAEIATARGVSVRTVANQVARLFKKLNATSRYELIQWTSLVRGRSTIVETIERDGKPMAIARHRDAGTRDALALTTEEREVVWRVAQAMPYKEIAYELGVPIATVAGRLQRAMRKLHVTSRVELLQRLGLR